MEGIVFLDSRRDEEIVQQLRNTILPTYIYGCGDIGIALYNYLVRNKVLVKAFVVDDDSFVNDSNRGVDIQRISEMEAKNELVNLMIGFADFQLGLTKAKKIKKINKVFCISNPYLYLQEFDITKSYFEKYSYKFRKSFELFEDDLSKEIMIAYLNTRINKNYEFLLPYGGCKTYFNEDIVKLSDDECYVDCGAFNGDSVRKFIESTCGKYEKIYAIEPDKENFKEMKQRLLKEKTERICLINKGVWYKQDKLGFSNEGKQEFSVDRNKNRSQYFLEVDSLDSMIGEKRVTLVKLSVQGSEEEAILGAENIIRTWNPTLAVTIFMKADALISIPQIIKRINPRYKLYLRCEEPFFARVILYAREGNMNKE